MRSSPACRHAWFARARATSGTSSTTRRSSNDGVMGRRRILVISSFLPSRESGGRVRLRALMRRLASSHSVSLLSYVSPTTPPEVIREVREQYDEVVTVPNERLARGKRNLQLRSLLSTRSFERLRYEQRHFQAALD